MTGPAPDRYAVIGNPIAHSQSPRIHRLFAQQTGQHMSYEAVLVPLDGLARFLDEFQQAGGRGLNITLPFKTEACALMQDLSPRARRAQAVNTVVFDAQGGRHGHNTDGLGLLRDLTANLGLELGGHDILMLGAGGAARGVMEPLLERRPARLVVANRTAGKAIELAAPFADLGAVSGMGLADLGSQRFDLVINATSAGVSGELPELPSHPFKPGAVFYDMMYGAKSLPFLTWALSAGAARVTDGLGMLVEQAAEAFLRWRGVRPATAPVIAGLRAELPPLPAGSSVHATG